jgi:hypothetical protein
MRIVKRILIALLVIFILIQFIRPDTNKHPGVQPNSILSKNPASPQVTAILQKACFDCHSNNTTYPWYSHIQPVAWWMDNHIRDGKKELNFDEFLTYPAKKQFKKIGKAMDEVKEGEMPLPSYTIIHKNAKLTDAEKQAFLLWASQVEKSYDFPAENNERQEKK